MKVIVLSASALKQLFALPAAAQETIEAALDAYAMTGRADIKRLKGSTLNRMRVGRYRVIFAEDETKVLAVEITKRDTTTYKGGSF